MRILALGGTSLVLLVLASCLAGQAEDEGAARAGRCTRTDDCAAGERCNEDGYCVPMPTPVCGNGQVEKGEECDDGEVNSHNGACTTSCLLARCGDGLTWVGHEECDDGNEVDEDLCKSDCTLNYCGDGVPGGRDERCDDGNQIEDDECTSRCASPSCPDGFVNSEYEQCDDGNDDDNDSCTSRCLQARCGDGIRYDGVEECDEGERNADTGWCTSACMLARCGDGLLQAGREQCDDGSRCENGDPCYGDADCGGQVGSCRPRGGDGSDESCGVEEDYCCVPGYECVSHGTIESAPGCRVCNTEISNISWSPRHGASCDDGDKCTLNDTCDDFTCVPGPPRTCSDGSVCTIDTCDPTAPGDGCVHTPAPNGRSCDDGYACNGTDSCSAGTCTHSGSPCSAPEPVCKGFDESYECVECMFNSHCDDRNPCTTDTCNPVLGTCKHEPVADGTTCNDSNACTTSDHCSAGECIGSGKSCPSGICHPMFGCP